MEINNELLVKKILESDMSKTEFGGKANVSRTTVHNIIKGHHQPSYSVIWLMSKALNLTAEELSTIFFPYDQSDE